MADITINDLTLSTVGGTGVFDVLMRATKAHLDQEFTKNRIKGAEYSTVYLGSLQAVMSASLEFLLQRQKAAVEAQLVAQQILLAEAQTALVTQQTENAVVENSVLVAQECKLRAEYDVIMLQKSRASAETALLVQKQITERAQTTALGVDADSIVGRQKNLYLAQTEGFARDAEQKAAKLMSDFWNVQRTTDEGIAPSEAAGNTDAYIGRAVKKMLEGVGA